MTHDTNRNMIEGKRVFQIAIITIALLCIPLLAMMIEGFIVGSSNQITRNVNWSVADFVVMGMLIFGTGIAYEHLKHKAATSNQRIVIAAAFLVLLFFVWAELAVGLFGSPFAGS